MKIKVDGKVCEVKKRHYDVNAVTKKHTAFDSFCALIHAPNGYIPSLYLGGKGAKAKRELLFLAREYNSAQRSRNDVRRVFQGDWVVISGIL